MNRLSVFWLTAGIIIYTNIANGQKKITYDFSCMVTDEAELSRGISSDVEKQFLNFFGSEVSINEEIKAGNSTLVELKKQAKFIESGGKLLKVRTILSSLITKISNPKGFNYSIYLMESAELNAFTCGGKIFITTGMINFCKSDDELACIISHEIAHNELGHINDQISRLKTAQTFGDIGMISAMVGKMLTSPFNQKNETHCDFKGIDLAKAAGYDACQNVNLWQRMNTIEGKNKSASDFFSTHPYSGTRAECSKNHLQINYSINCN